MRNRSGIQGVASSPVLVGAVTVLVVIVAVFLAYNANNGLPFVSTYNLKARVPNADALVKGNEVRIGGVRVGIVKSVVPVQLGDGRVAAELALSLDKNVEPLPVDSTMIDPAEVGARPQVPADHPRQLVRRASPPAKRSRSPPPAPNRSTSTSSSTCSTNRPAKAIRQNLAGFGNALAGRGPQLNEAIGALRRLVESGQPVLRTIVAPSTNFAGFWRALEDLSATVAPVAETQASLFVALDRTFAAFARVSRPFIQETIAKGPPTLDAANADLPALRPFLHDSERFFTALKPGAKALAETSPTIAAALHAGVPVLNASPVLNAQLPPTAEALLAFQDAPGVFNGLDLLIDTNELLEPGARVHRPGPDHLQLRSPSPSATWPTPAAKATALGNWLNFISFEPPEGPNSEGDARLGAGQRARSRTTTSTTTPIPNTAAPGQPNECEAGNEKYTDGPDRDRQRPGNQGTITSGQIKGQGGEDEPPAGARHQAGRDQPPLQVAAEQRR